MQHHQPMSHSHMEAKKNPLIHIILHGRNNKRNHENQLKKKRVDASH